MGYKDSKTVFETLITMYGEVKFRMSLGWLFEKGFETFRDENEVNEAKDEYAKRDDSKEFMTNEFAIDLIEMAHTISKCDVWHLIKFMKAMKIDV